MDTVTPTARSCEDTATQWLGEDCRVRLLLDVINIVGDCDQAEDIVQDTILKVAQSRLGASRIGLSYVRRAARNRALNCLRDERRRKGRGLPDPLSARTTAEFVDSTLYEERRDWLRCELRKLPARCATVAQMHWIDGFTCADVAMRLGCSIKTVEHHVSRALKRVRLAAERERAWIQRDLTGPVVKKASPPDEASPLERR
ncbi:MAG: RNA polymerase sigma factor [Longimicrobiales bacterium]